MKNEKMIEYVNDIFMQDDNRYFDPLNSALVAVFVEKGAIQINHKDISPSNISINGIRGPQKQIKAVAIQLLKKRGYEIVSIERGFPGGIPDILAKDGETNITIECGPCRISKAVDYLQTPSTKLWIIKPTNGKYTLFEISRGENWDKVFNKYQKYQLDQAKKHINNAFEDFE